MDRLQASALKVNSSALSRALLVVVAVLLVAHLAGQYCKYELGHERLFGLVPFFNMDHEHNVPAFFSMLLLLFAALLLAVVALVNRARAGSYNSRWWMLALGFLYMSFDEAFSLHERLIEPMRSVLVETGLVATVDGAPVFGVLYYAWVVVALAGIAVLAPYFLMFLLHLRAPVRLHLLAAAALYLGGAIGFELFSGRYAERHGRESFAYALFVAGEETLEMVGVIVLIRGILRHCAETYGEVRLAFGK